jgi:hypothetical protein
MFLAGHGIHYTAIYSLKNLRSVSALCAQNPIGALPGPLLEGIQISHLLTALIGAVF